MKRSAVIAVAGLFVAGALMSQAAPKSEEKKPEKPSWEWSVEERLAKRFDPVAAAAREAERRDSSRSAFPQNERFEQSMDSKPAGHAVRGRETPELFFPFELFDALIHRCFPPDGLHQGEWRRRTEEKAAALGFGRDLWPRLAKAAAPLLELNQTRYEQALAQRRSPRAKYAPEADTSGLPARCRIRSEALANAKAEFGEEAFLRFLYQAVAPHLTLSYTPQDDFAGHLRYLEEGCR